MKSHFIILLMAQIVWFSAPQSNGEEIPEPSFVYVQSGSVVIAISKNHMKCNGFSISSGKWATYDIPKGLKVIPVVSNDVAALQMSGGQVSQLVAFSGETGNWSKLNLEMRDQPKVATPIVGNDLVCFQLKDKIAAYSPFADKWGILKTDGQPQVGDNTIVVDTKQHLAIFSSKTGTWATLKKE